MITAARNNARNAVTVEGQAVSILAVSIVFSVLITAIVWMRVYVRVTIRHFGADDWLMCFGWAFGILNNAVAIWGGLFGLGMPDSRLTQAQAVEAEKAVFAWEVAYSVAVTFVKASICMALLRIAEQKVYRIILWFMIVITTVTDAAELVAAIFGYQAISDNWQPGPDSTYKSGSNKTIFQSLVYIEYAVYIAVDIACVLLPIFILWSLQMKKSIKITTAGILGLGAFATVATIIRLPITLQFNNETDRLLHRGRAVICGLVELNLGIIAGSVPPLQKLLDILFGPRQISSQGHVSPAAASPSPRTNNEDFDLVSIGEILRMRPSSRRRQLDEEVSIERTLHDPEGRHGELVNDDADDDSTRRMIKTSCTEETAVESESELFRVFDITTDEQS